VAVERIGHYCKADWCGSTDGFEWFLGNPTDCLHGALLITLFL
jgi:hypothetical protein